MKVVTTAFEGTNTLIVLDDCAASRDVKGRTGKLVELSFSAAFGHFCLGVDTEDNQHNTIVPRKRGGDCSFLHAFSQNDESNFRRL